MCAEQAISRKELTLAVGDVGSSKSRFRFSGSTSCLLFFILSRRSPVGLSADLLHYTNGESGGNEKKTNK